MHRFICLLPVCFFVCTTSNAQDAKKIQVALLVGDTQSAASIAAIHQLKSDSELSKVNIRVFPKIKISDIDRQFVRDSQIIIAYTRYAELVRTFANEIETAVGHGAMVASVGSTLDSEFENLGLKRDPELAAYFDAGGSFNIMQMIRAALARKQMQSLRFEPPQLFPELGYFLPATGKPFESFDDYRSAYLIDKATQTKPWVGVYFSRETATSGQTELLSVLDQALQARGLNTLFGFGYPGDLAVPKLFVDAEGLSRIDALIGLTLKIGNVPEKIIPVLERSGVPVINAIALNSQNYRDWENSATGLDLIERSWQVGAAELAGAIAPTVVASKEQVTDVETGESYVLSLPISERIERLADRIQAWIKLRKTEASQRRVAIVYYNYPPGKESIGASYLNVLPKSLSNILKRMRGDGLELMGAPENDDDLFATIRTFGNNPTPGPNLASELDQLARSNRVQLLPVAQYRKWFDELPLSLKTQIVRKWGEPEDSQVMTWRDDSNEPYFVFPAQIWGNVLLAPQPTRGWDQDISAAYHDVKLPPHHQYVAFYLWLQKQFRTDVMLHVGTHATHEWLPGKEVGFNADDTGEVIVGSVPQLYIYIVDDVGEGLQAKRRAMATIITHLTPPLDKATLSPELRAITSLIGDLQIAKDKGSLASSNMLQDLTERCVKHGLLKDLSIALGERELLDEEQIEEVEHHLKRVGEKLTPFGMHTFGVAPSIEQQTATAEAILSTDSSLNGAELEAQKADLIVRINRSGMAELDAMSAGLSGKYIPAGPGNDPVRNPNALPTGKNFFGFDPSRMPTPATYLAGQKMAEELIQSFGSRHQGAFPNRLVFNLWGTESSRHEGVIESQILALMGVRPVWDSRGRVQDVELIGREELGRSRVDVTIVPSGLYRDLFSKLMLLLDRAVEVVKSDKSADNPLLKNIASARAELIAQGVSPEDAERFASVRLFSVPSGAYGAGLDHVIQHEDSWTDEKEVSAVYFNRMSHMFGQGFWGSRATGGSKEDISPVVMKLALRGAKGVVHSRSSNVYGAIDSDDFYQYLGGTAMAVREVNGEAAETLVADLSNPKAGETLTLEKYMGREMRARYLNPKWIEAMLGEGYAGSRMIRQVTDNLWGWQVTVPDAVDAAKWQEMYEVYVKDRHELNIREKFAKAENLAAYQAMVERMIKVVEKGYWDAPAETVAQLNQTKQELVGAVLKENENAKANAELQPAPSPFVASDSNSLATNPVVKGFAVEPKSIASNGQSTKHSTGFDRILLVGFAAVTFVAFGWWHQGRRT